MGLTPICVMDSQPYRIQMEWNEDEPGNYTGRVIRITGGDQPDLEDVTILVTHNNRPGSTDLGTLAGAEPLTVESMTLTFTDTNNDGELGPGDVFQISGGIFGDWIYLCCRYVCQPAHIPCNCRHPPS